MLTNKAKAIILAIVTTSIVSVAQIFLKQASEAFSISFDMIYNVPLLIGIALYFSGAFVLVKAFRLGEYSLVYPIMSVSYIIVTLLSVYFFGEIMTTQKWIGLAIITGGVVFIGKGGKE